MEPEGRDHIMKEIDRLFITGLTCGNDTKRFEWAVTHGIDYISFCAVFPSPSAGSCELVRLETIRKVRKITSMPIFASGGVRPDNVNRLLDLGIDGVAVISGILNDEHPEKTARRYKEVLGN